MTEAARQPTHGKIPEEESLNYLFRNQTSEFPHSSFLCKNESTLLFVNVCYLGHTSKWLRVLKELLSVSCMRHPN